MTPCPDCSAPLSGRQQRCPTCQRRRDAQVRNLTKRLRRNQDADDPCAACWFAPQCHAVTQNISDDVLPCFPASHVHREYLMWLTQTERGHYADDQLEGRSR